MIRVLVNAYACSPGMGSEPGMAWNWCVNLAKYCELHIITEGEFRDKIELTLPTLPQGVNMHFYYNPVTDKVRKMCWNQGDWRFYKYYKEWQYKTYLLAQDIINDHNIDIVHQLNMIGFREPGYLWKLDKPFVWGPIGGLKQFPEAYLNGAGIKMKLLNKFKNIINILQVKYDSRVSRALHRSCLLISSIPNSYKAIKLHHGLESVIIPETGCYIDSRIVNSLDRFCNSQEFVILWVGKFDFRKQLEIAIKSFAKIQHLDGVRLEICGTGSDEQVAFYKKLAYDLGVLGKIKWCGNLSNIEVLEKMRRSQLFLFTSVDEDTSTVVMESLGCSLPILCFDTCGFGAVVDERVGAKIELSKPRQSVEDFADKIDYLYHNRVCLKEMSEECGTRQLELSWDNKALHVLELYKNISHI